MDRIPFNLNLNALCIQAAVFLVQITFNSLVQFAHIFRLPSDKRYLWRHSSALIPEHISNSCALQPLHGRVPNRKSPLSISRMYAASWRGLTCVTDHLSEPALLHDLRVWFHGLHPTTFMSVIASISCEHNEFPVL